MSEFRVLRSGLDPDFSAGYDLVPVDHDPFAGAPAPSAPPVDPSDWRRPAWTRPATAAELQTPGRDAVSDPLGNLTTDPTGLVGQVQGITGLPAAVRAHYDRLADLKASGASDEQIADASKDNPLYNLAFSAALPLVGKGLPALGGIEGAAPIGAFARSESGAARVRGTPPRVGPDLTPEAAAPSAEARIGPDLTPAAAEAPSPAEAPITAAMRQTALANELREQHLARGDQGIPLLGTQKITMPPNILTRADYNDLVNNYMDYAREGEPYTRYSGASILEHAGDPGTATRFAGGLAITSPQTPVPTNTGYAVRAHNAAALGMDIPKGLFPIQEPALEGLYYGQNFPVAEKIGPFHTAMGEEWDPHLGVGHNFVNDIWNMRALGFEGPPGADGLPTPYKASPTTAQHNFARIVANDAMDRLANEPPRTVTDTIGTDAEGKPITRERTLQPIQFDSPKQLQASVWASIKARSEGTSLEDAARDFSDFLASNYGQQSWESAPGPSTGHFPEFASASPEQQAEFHKAMLGAITDDQGHDIIDRHLGLMTGRTLEAPGVWGGQVSPGAQGMMVLGPAPGGAAGTGGGMVDPASRMLADTSARLHALVFRQDEAGWHRPFYIGKDPQVQNLAHFDLGRPPTAGEALAGTEAMNNAAEAAGGKPEFSAISSPTGFRFLNDPAKSGLSHPAFQKAARALNDPRLPDLRHVAGHADTFLDKNDWQENPNGEGYLNGIGGTRSPDLQRRAAEILAELGPRISAIEEDFAKRYGWTPNRESRVWETNPIIQRHAGVAIPTPPQPWLQRPAPPGSGSLLFGGGAP